MSTPSEPMPHVPEFSYGDFDMARDEFAELDHVTGHDYGSRLTAAYHDLLGPAGEAEQERAEQLLDRVRSLYTSNDGTTTNFRKAAFRALEIFEEASYLQAGGLAGFLDSRVTIDEIAQLHERRGPELQRVVRGVTTAISRRHQKYGADYRGVVGAIIHGSYADGTFLPGQSDIDMVLVTDSADQGMEHDGEWIDYSEDAERALSAHVNRPLDTIEVTITNTPNMRGLTGDPDSTLYESNYLVVAPDDSVRQQINGLLEAGRSDARVHRELEAGAGQPIPGQRRAGEMGGTALNGYNETEG
jgi:hypothetical protein